MIKMKGGGGFNGFLDNVKKKLLKWYRVGFPKVFRLLILNRQEDINVCKNKRGKGYYHC